MRGSVLQPSNALHGLRLGISVSDSADLPRLGLESRHVELLLAELARSVLLLHGNLVYGGRIEPPGYTQFLMHEIERYGTNQEALLICLAAPEHEKLPAEALTQLGHQLGIRGRVILLTPEGKEMGRSAVLQTSNNEYDVQTSYSAMRHYVSERSDARVIMGGQLDNFNGTMPGVIEETIFAIQARQPLYVVGGFGGAAALVAKTLEIDKFEWAPKDFPQRPNDNRISEALLQLETVAGDSDWSMKCSGLDDLELRQLASSHRPREIASLIVNGLTRMCGNSND